jgi:Xaa-Pro aminopeptidase
MDPLRSLDALLIVNPVNIKYLTGFVGAAPEEHEVYLLKSLINSYLFTNSLYLERAEALAQQQPDLLIIRISRDQPITQAVKQIVKTLKIKKLGFEARELTFAEYIDFARILKGVKLIPTIDRIEDLRMIKRPDEMKNIRKAVEITDAAFAYIIKQLKLGISETKLADKIEAFFKTKQAKSAFSAIVAFGSNASQPHYIPSPKCKLKRGDTILFDIGAKFNGYCADMTRVIFTSPPSPELAHVYQTVLAAQAKAIDVICRQAQTQQFKKSNTISGSNLDKSARNLIKKAGFPPYSHSLGHNVGLSIHEKPRLTIKKSSEIKSGMVFSIEPGIYVPGKFGIRIEDLVYLDENGLEILPRSPKNLTIIKI